jgi:hypothetical protein
MYQVDAASLAPAMDISKAAANNARRSIREPPLDQIGFNAERLSL